MADLGFGLPPVSVAQFVQGAIDHHITVVVDNTDYRVGQAFSNYLSHHFPGVAARIIATRCDPYYNDSNISDMLEFLIDYGVLDD